MDLEQAAQCCLVAAHGLVRNQHPFRCCCGRGRDLLLLCVKEGILFRYAPDCCCCPSGGRCRRCCRGCYSRPVVPVLLAGLPREVKVLADLIEKIKESNIPILVELRDWTNLPERFQKNIEQKYEVVFDNRKDNYRIANSN